MRILSIETSCDETAAAVVEADEKTKTITLLSNVVASSLSFHAKTGGIIPEVAAREQLKYIIPVITQALQESDSRHSGLSRIQLSNKDSGVAIAPQNDKFLFPNIDAIAVTYGPGLIGSLLVGVETAKTLSFVWKKPIIPVNHLYGHIYANFIGANPKSEIRNPKLNAKCYSLNAIVFPTIALIVSGGHTDLVFMKDHGKLQWLGGTRDDAAGEAFDKIGRLLNLPYPAGPTIEKLAKNGNPKAYNFPRPLLYDKEFDFSFSGLKTAVFRETQTIQQYNNTTIANLCASVQQAIIDVLMKKTLNAAEKYNAKSILLGGGVAANSALRDAFLVQCSEFNVDFFAPQKSLCTDNAAMIGAAAFFNYKEVPWQKITADPELYFD